MPSRIFWPSLVYTYTPSARVMMREPLALSAL